MHATVKLTRSPLNFSAYTIGFIHSFIESSVAWDRHASKCRCMSAKDHCIRSICCIIFLPKCLLFSVSTECVCIGFVSCCNVIFQLLQISHCCIIKKCRVCSLIFSRFACIDHNSTNTVAWLQDVLHDRVAFELTECI